MKFDLLWKLKLEEISSEIMNVEPLRIKTLVRNGLPKRGGVYLVTNQNDECVYVGKTGDLRRRVFDAHLNGKGRSSFRQASGSKKDKEE
jgi:hypothetical protein